MRIALIGYEANIRHRVGSNQYAYELIKALYRLDVSNEYFIYLPSFPLADLPKERKGWHYLVVGPSRLWNVFGLPFALKRLRPKPDIVFSPGHYSPLFFPSPLVVSIMDLGYLHYPQQFTKPILTKLKFWTAISIKRAAHVLAISESTRNDIIKEYRVEPGKVSVTLLGYDREKFNPRLKGQEGENVRVKYGIEGDFILFLGTLKPNKNIEGLIEGFKRIEDKGLKLVIAGRKGWLSDSIFEKAKRLGIENKVIFTGFVDEDDKASLMSEAKVFVLPSFWEGFGIPAIEAMACGTPAVVSRVGSLPEIVGEAGVLIDPFRPDSIADGIRQALNNRKKLVEKGYRQVEKFSWEKCSRETLKVIEEVGGLNNERA